MLLDLGLVTGLARSDQSATMQAVGTAAYVAPEQAASQHLGAEADWHSVGIVLYEARTGRVPFAGETLTVMLDKQRGEPDPPHALVPDVPADLDAPCVALLRFDPRARPTGGEVLRRLGVSDAPLPGAALPRSSASLAPLFVGRQGEMAALEDTYQTSQRGAAVADGGSGQAA